MPLESNALSTALARVTQAFSDEQQRRTQQKQEAGRNGMRDLYEIYRQRVAALLAPVADAVTKMPQFRLTIDENIPGKLRKDFARAHNSREDLVMDNILGVLDGHDGGGYIFRKYDGYFVKDQESG